MARTKQTSRVEACAITLTNLTHNETIHQRALLLKGHITLPSSPPSASPTYISIKTTSQNDTTTPTFPEQTWPVQPNGHFSALILLQPGPNLLHLHWHDDHYTATLTHPLTHLPLQHLPPLHLAILVASNSPLLLDCPPHKAAGLSTAHASLPAAVAKLRMAAYMWQAATAEHMRARGLGRRSFRLEDEWGLDTLSSAFLSADDDSPYRASAKVHVVRSERTVEELRQPRKAGELHGDFRAALRGCGAPFAAGVPGVVVAGLVLDSHYSAARDAVLAEPVAGGGDGGRGGGAEGFALAAFGSQTCWAWPRFVEEVAGCLLDATASRGCGVSSGGNGECGTSWEACCSGQAGMLREVAGAFGCQVGERDSKELQRSWASGFVAGPSLGLRPHQPLGATGEGLWDLGDALALRCCPQFRLPTDEAARMEKLARGERPVITVRYVDGEVWLKVSAEGGLARIDFNGKQEDRPSVAESVECRVYVYDELDARFGRQEALEVSAMGMNGRAASVGNVWALFGRLSFIRVPGSDVVLQKQSVKSRKMEAYDEGPDGYEGHEFWQWAAMLKERGKDGQLTHANAFDMRVGCSLDGGVLYYTDGHKTHLGPRVNKYGEEHHFGGHASEIITLSPDIDIVKLEINRRSYELFGLRTTLADGTVRGELNEVTCHDPDVEVVALEPGPGERIVGFFGRSDWNRGFNGILEFGIFTAPKGAELPDSVYDVAELKNTDGGLEEVRRRLEGPRGRKRAWRSDDDED